MKKNNSALWLGALILLAIVVLFAWPRFTNPYRKTIGMWKDLEVDCLPGHQNAALHIHSGLKIVEDKKIEAIPANIGIVRGCMAEVHTHETDGMIHIESVKAGKTFTLGQFFSVWGKEMDREGFTLTTIVDGESVADSSAIILADHQVIEMTYAPAL